MSELSAIDLAAATNAPEDTMEGQYLAINLDDQQFGIPIGYVTDIIQVQPITKVPNCPGFITGITNLRGKVIPIMDLRLRFSKPPQEEFTDRTCIIVLEDEGASVGLIVDSVSVVLNLDDNMISPPPTFHQGLDTKFIQGVNRSESGVTLIMNCKTVLDDGALNLMGEEENF